MRRLTWATLKGSPYVAFGIAALLVARPFQGRVDGQRPARATVYEGARLIDGNGGSSIEDSAFVVADGRFTQIGRKSDVRAPADAAHVDLSGKTVMPALVDAHAHLGYRKGTTFSADNFTRENILNQLNQLAYWGVSGVLSTGTDIGDLIFQIRNASNAPNGTGTLVRTAWRGIAPPDAGPFPPMRAAPFGVTTEAGARASAETDLRPAARCARAHVSRSRSRRRGDRASEGPPRRVLHAHVVGAAAGGGD